MPFDFNSLFLQLGQTIPVICILLVVLLIPYSVCLLLQNFCLLTHKSDIATSIYPSCFVLLVPFCFYRNMDSTIQTFSRLLYHLFSFYTSFTYSQARRS